MSGLSVTASGTRLMRVCVHKTGTMQALLTSIARGYGWHFSGTVTPDKAAALAAKFEGLYLTELTEDQRGHRRRRGQGNARLFMHPSYLLPEVHWWILLTEGDHPAKAAEAKNLAAVTDARWRLTFQDQFEAVRLPREGDTTRWTWRLTPKYQASLRGRYSELLRHRKDNRELAQALRTLHRLPGFHGIRRQVIEMLHEVEEEWKRVHPTGMKKPLPAGFQPFVRRKVYATVPLEVVCNRLIAGQPPYSVEMRYVPRPGVEAEPDKLLNADLPEWRRKMIKRQAKTKAAAARAAPQASARAPEMTAQGPAYADAVDAQEQAMAVSPQAENVEDATAQQSRRLPALKGRLARWLGGSRLD